MEIKIRHAHMFKKIIWRQVSAKLGRKWDSYKLTLGTEIDKLTFQRNYGNV